MIRIGIIGCGSIYKTHADAIGKIEGAELAGVMDVLPERARAAGRAYGVPGHTRISTMLRSVDAVCVCTPSGLHARVGARCAREGKHVLVEKPIDTTEAKGRSLIAICRRNGVKLAVVSQHRFARDVQRLRHEVQAGALGVPVHAEVVIKWFRTQAYYDSGSWRGTWLLDGGGCLINQGIHYIDLLQWIMGGVSAVWAQTRTSAHAIEVEDVAAAVLEFRNGAIGVLQGSTSCYPGFKERIEVSGRHGTAVLEGDRIVFLETDPSAPANPSPYGRDLEYHPLPTHALFQSRPPEEEDPTVAWDMQHRMQIQDFVDAIREDREPFVSGEDALEALRVVKAVYRSARLDGRRVNVS